MSKSSPSATPMEVGSPPAGMVIEALDHTLRRGPHETATKWSVESAYRVVIPPVGGTFGALHLRVILSARRIDGRWGLTHASVDVEVGGVFPVQQWQAVGHALTRCESDFAIERDRAEAWLSR